MGESQSRITMTSLRRNRIGIPTGLLQKDRHLSELQKIRAFGLGAIEIHDDCSFLLRDAVDMISSVSVHASKSNKRFVIEAIKMGVNRVILHPSELDNDPFWIELGDKLLLENLDPNFPSWRTAQDMIPALEMVPEASICLDIAHTVQDDAITSGLIHQYKDRIKQVHFSEIDPITGLHHETISDSACAEIKWIHHLHPDTVIIIELGYMSPWSKTCAAIEKIIGTHDNHPSHPDAVSFAYGIPEIHTLT